MKSLCHIIEFNYHSSPHFLVSTHKIYVDMEDDFNGSLNAQKLKTATINIYKQAIYSQVNQRLRDVMTTDHTEETQKTATDMNGKRSSAYQVNQQKRKNRLCIKINKELLQLNRDDWESSIKV